MRRRMLALAMATAATLGSVLLGGTATAQTGQATARSATPDGAVVDHPVPSVGCWLPTPVRPGATIRGTVSSGGTQRSYLAELPPDYRPWRAQSLVLSFHGQSRTSEYQRELTGFAAPGTVAVYPQGVPGTEDGKTAWQGAPYSAAVDDVRFTSDLLNHLQRRLCVDPARIFATGKSNGGGFTGMLACRLGGRIAAFAPVAGAFYPQAGDCDPRRPVPVLEIHGGADDTIPYDGDPQKGLPALPDWLAGWADRNGCALDPSTRDLGNGVQRSVWRGCDGRGALRHYRVDGLAHDWPSTSPNPDSDTPSVLDATPLVAKFFRNNPLY